jgi:hypothetical protein
VSPQLLLAPYVPVHLRHSYAADILCSLNKVFVSAIFSVCYFGSGAYRFASNPGEAAESSAFSVCTTNPGMVFLKTAIMVLPYAIRLTQCLRQRRDHFVRLDMAAKAAAAPKIAPPEDKTPVSSRKCGKSSKRIRIASAKNSKADLLLLGSTAAQETQDLGPGAPEAHSDINSPGQSEALSPAEGSSRKGLLSEGGTSATSSGRIMYGAVFVPSNPDEAVPESTDDERDATPENIFGSPDLEYEYEDVLEEHEPGAEGDGDDDYDVEAGLDQHEQDLHDVSELHDYDAAELDEELYHEGNNFGFDEDDAVVALEGAWNPLHLSDKVVEMSTLSQRSASVRSNRSNHALVGAEVGFEGTSNVSSQRDPSSKLQSIKSGVTSEAFTPLTPLSPDDAGEHTDSEHTTTGRAKSLRRHSNSFYKTLHEGIEVTKRVRAGLKSTLSRSEVHDLPMPPAIRALRKFLPDAFATIMVWPYSYNALRYFCSILVILIGVYPPQDPTSASFMGCYYGLYVFSTLFNVYWDVANDFKLLQFDSTRPLLRDNLLYADSEYFYYAVLVINPIFRFLWTLNFTPYGSQIFLLLFEIMRRSLWACIRMELGYIQELARRR